MLIAKLKQKISSPFVRNVGWLGGGELLNRIFRLGTTVVLARQLSPHDYGLAAIVLTINEFTSVFTLGHGIGGKIIQADEKDVEEISNTAYWINWIVGVSLFIIQCIAAFPLAFFYKNNQLILPICIVATEYLMWPFFAIQMARIERENRLKVSAIANSTQSFFANIASITLALLGMKMWAIVLPAVLTVPVWIVIARKHHSWRPSGSFSLKRWQEIVHFGKNVIAVEFLDKLRANIDYLLVGMFIGINELGIYYFAFNAGLGISLNIINVLTWPLFPHLCTARGNLEQLKSKYFTSLKTIALVVIPMVLLQSSLSPFYVPIVFGQKWVIAIPILILICLSAIPRPFSNAATMLLLAVDKADINLKWSLIFTVIFAMSLMVGLQGGILAVAAAVFISHAVAMPIFSIWATKYVIRTQSSLAK
ncbi:MAG TPA: lipopolysaccharide biosynthesis protein [Waterburya sp.]|jgi:PST family polysaccharide transporter